MKNFRKCETCGSHGHGGRACPVYRLNQQQERRRAHRRRDLSFGLTPELEREIILIRKAWKIAAALGSILLCATSLFAGTITGRLQTATGGAVTNGTLSFRLSQPAVLVGSASLVTSPASCYISAAGNIAGVPDPLVAPVLTANTISGTLPAGTYFVVVTYAGASGESVASPESTVVLSAQGTVIVAAPVKQPSNATGFNVYIGTASGAETLQASVTGFTQYSQTSALGSGAALPASNSSVCSLAFSDQLIPSGTYYAVNLVNKNGSTIAGFPQTWCIYGGQSGTINVSNGAPTGNCGTNGVIYPTPIFAAPQNNAPQSISSPMTFGGTVAFNASVTESLSHTLTNPGVFTNTQVNLSLSVSLNGCSPLTEYQAAQGANATTEPITGCVTVPSNSTVHQADGGGFFVRNNSTATNAVGVYSQAICVLSNTSCWGADPVSTDVAGLTGVTLYGTEVDTGPQNPLASYAGVTGVSSNLTGSLGGSGSVGTAFIANSNTAGRFWNHGFETKDAAVNTAFLGGTTCTVGDCGSQAAQLRAFHSGSLVVASYAIDTNGNWIFTLPAGKSLFNGSAQLTQIAATGTATVDLASVASGACTADSSDVTLTGAAVGDPVRVTAATALPAGVWLIGRVTATNTGRFQLCNLSGGAVDRASDTYTISVVK